ncbi:MAG: hypothetical protein P8182_12115 [Deltaproteobacteria bacterium]
MGLYRVTRCAFFAATMVAISVMVVGLAHSLTCEECQKIEKDVKAAQKELSEKANELKAAFDNKQYATVTEVRNRMNELRLKLLELRKQTAPCRDACKPDVVKAAECRKIEVEIGKLDSEGSQSADRIKQVDDLYRDLARCHDELRRLLGRSE